MASIKNVLAVIGLVSVIAFVGVCVALMASGGDNANGPDPVPDADADASTDGLTKDEIQAKLQHYADILNADDGKDHYLIVSGSVKTYTHSQSSVTSESMIHVKPGSVKVTDGDLAITVSESTTYNSGLTHTTTYYSSEYLIPYHAIAGIKIIKKPNPSDLRTE